jgi:hypothetical protein
LGLYVCGLTIRWRLRLLNNITKSIFWEGFFILPSSGGHRISWVTASVLLISLPDLKCHNRLAYGEWRSSSTHY